MDLSPAVIISATALVITVAARIFNLGGRDSLLHHKVDGAIQDIHELKTAGTADVQDLRRRTHRLTRHIMRLQAKVAMIGERLRMTADLDRIDQHLNEDDAD